MDGLEEAKRLLVEIKERLLHVRGYDGHIPIKDINQKIDQIQALLENMEVP